MERNLIDRSFIPALDQIDAMEKNTNVIISHKGALNLSRGSLQKNKTKGFELSLRLPIDTELKVGEELRFGIKSSIELKVTSSFCRTHSFTTKNRTSPTHKVSIRSMQSGISKGRRYFGRTIIKINRSLPFYNVIDTQSYSFGTSSAVGLIKVSLSEGNRYNVYSYTRGKDDYLIIDSLTKRTAEQFRDESWNIQVALGFLQSYLPQEEEFCFFYSKKRSDSFTGFQYNVLRDSLKSLYVPVYSNPHAWKIRPRRLINKYAKGLKNVSQEEFSNLCTWVNLEIDIRAIIMLIIESSTRSLLAMPAGLSVALEGVAEHFYEKSESAFKPISDKKLSKKIIDELRSTLSFHKMDPAIASYETLIRKIDTLNAPTNREKLTIPFRVLNIPLSDIDREVIEYRNDFLHGNINLTPRKGGKTYSMSTYEIALRLLTLLNAIVLKKVGYTGVINNHVKLQEGQLIKDIKEPHYRSI